MKTSSRYIFNTVTFLTVFAMLFGFFATSSVRAEPLASLGDFLWAKSVGGSAADAGNSVTTDASGNVYTVGSFNGVVNFGAIPLTSAGGSDIFVSKSDGNGNFVSAKSIGGTDQESCEGGAIAVDSQNNVYLACTFKGDVDFGPTHLTSAGGTDIFVSKLDSNGDFVWTKDIIGAPGDEGARGIAVDSNGNVYVTGYYNTMAGEAEIFVSKLDSNGNSVTENDITGGGNDYPDDLALDASGNVYITGSYAADLAFGTTTLISAGFNDIFVSKLDGNLNFVWAKAMSGPDNDGSGNGIALDSSGNVYTTGLFYGEVDFDPGSGTSPLISAGGSDIFVSKLDKDGNFIWAKGMGSNDPTTFYEAGSKIVVDSVGNVLTTGYFLGNADFDPGLATFPLSSKGGSDIFVSELDSNGNFVGANRMGGTPNFDLGLDIAKDATDDIFVTGQFYGTDADFGNNILQSAGDADVFIAKLENSFVSAVSISGNAGVAGATLTVTNNSPSQFVADGSGNYTISVAAGWSGTVTPSKSGYTFSPPSRSYTNLQSNQTGQDYTAQVLAGGADTTGVFRPSNGVIFLKNANTTGIADIGLNYGIPGDYPVVGDWDGNGTTTIGIYRNGSFYLRNSNTIGFADMVFAFGQPGDQPVAGDWDGDHIDTIGVYHPSNGQFMLRNSNSAGAADTTFFLGIPGDVGIAGDWNGDGMDTTGVFRPSNGIIFLKNANTTGIADIGLNYGIPGDKPVIGDWDADGIDTIGVYRGNVFYLRNSNTVGFADIVFALGIPSDMPIAGNWDGLP